MIDKLLGSFEDVRYKNTFLGRLSSLIIIQVLFCFAALVLILFAPVYGGKVSDVFETIKDRFGGLVTDTHHILSSENQPGNDKLSSLYSAVPEVRSVYLFTRSSEDSISCIYTYSGDSTAVTSNPLLTGPIDAQTIDLELSRSEPSQKCLVLGEQQAVCYHLLLAGSRKPVLMVMTINHGLIITDRSNTLYAVFVLFLVSVLLSLLTVYLISRRFRLPLERLMRGFEKTSQGEVFHIIVSEGDRELQTLARAFNKMSETLFNRRRQLNLANEKQTQASLLLLQAQKFMSTLIDSSPSAIMTATPWGQLVVFNRQASDLFGYSREQAGERTIDELFTQSVRQSLQDVPDSEGNSGVEVLCRKNGGEIFPAYLIVRPIYTTEGEEVAHLYIVRDISESESFQEMMIHIDRYCTRGEMAGDIAHEINNYLTVLSGNLELMPLMLQTGDADKIDARLETMRGTVDRITKFTEGLMDVGECEVSFQLTDANQLVENVIAFLKPQNRFDNIDFHVDLADNLSVAELDPVQIQQVLVNLVHNAGDALSERQDDASIIMRTATTELNGEPAILIEVADNGPGVPAEKEPMLFNRRFTTKRKGHGIGLVTCRKIVDAHGGVLRYSNNGGAVFTFVLPVKKNQSNEDSESAQPSLSAVVS